MYASPRHGAVRLFYGFFCPGARFMSTAVAPEPKTSPFADLDSHYPLTPEQIRQYRENGFIKLKHVLSPQTLAHYGKEFTAKVKELNTNLLPIEKRDTYGKAFLQVTNLWTKSEVVKEFVFGKRLGRIAAELMGTRGVRMYHDQALYKEAGGGLTPWHADQYYWPLGNPNTTTAWIPLQKTPMEMGPLAFAVKSQNMEFGRDLQISDTSEQQLQDALKREGYALLDEPFDLGEISFHMGWTYHRAGPNTSGRPREVMTIIYMDQDMTVMKPKHRAQESDLKAWLPGATVGEVADSPLNPVLYTAK
jgi:ectoine hydroxylase-related dioxygenase (phytanoyl-CoA dioxygenase family)